MRLTELEWGLSNTPAFEKVHCLMNEAMRRFGYTFSPNDLHSQIKHFSLSLNSISKAQKNNLLWRRWRRSFLFSIEFLDQFPAAEWRIT